MVCGGERFVIWVGEGGGKKRTRSAQEIAGELVSEERVNVVVSKREEMSRYAKTDAEQTTPSRNLGKSFTANPTMRLRCIYVLELEWKWECACGRCCDRKAQSTNHGVNNRHLVGKKSRSAKTDAVLDKH